MANNPPIYPAPPKEKYWTETLPRYGRTIVQIGKGAEIIGSIIFDDNDPDIKRLENIIRTQMNI